MDLSPAQAGEAAADRPATVMTEITHRDFRTFSVGDGVRVFRDSLK